MMQSKNKNVLDLHHQYSDGINNTKIAILGPYPPPLGGVSIHVRRVMTKLKKQKNNVECFDTTAPHRWGVRKFFVYPIKFALFLLRFRPKIVHFHTSYLQGCMLELKLIFFLKKIIGYDVVYIEHGCRHMYKRTERFKRRLSNMLCDQSIVFIGDSTHTSYIENNFVMPKNISIESAFLPPDRSREQKIIATYPNSLFSFIENKKPFIVANAFQLSLLDGKDLYGFDMCIELIHKLKPSCPQVALVFALAQIGDQNYYKKICADIERLQLGEQIYFLQDQKELWPLLGKADLFVRPSLSDSCGISVGEALYLGTPAIASDVCARAKGTVLFETGNKKDFFEKVFCELRQKDHACFKNEKRASAQHQLQKN